MAGDGSNLRRGRGGSDMGIYEDDLAERKRQHELLNPRVETWQVIMFLIAGILLVISLFTWSGGGIPADEAEEESQYDRRHYTSP